MASITNQDQLRRTVEALTETSRLIERELAYQPKFRKIEYLVSLESHAETLSQMIRAAMPHNDFMAIGRG